jgi:hypothetical protein
MHLCPQRTARAAWPPVQPTRLGRGSWGERSLGFHAVLSRPFTTSRNGAGAGGRLCLWAGQAGGEGQVQRQGGVGPAQGHNIVPFRPRVRNVAKPRAHLRCGAEKTNPTGTCAAPMRIRRRACASHQALLLRRELHSGCAAWPAKRACCRVPGKALDVRALDYVIRFGHSFSLCVLACAVDAGSTS